MMRREEDGAIVPMSPKDSPWYQYYVVRAQLDDRIWLKTIFDAAQNTHFTGFRALGMFDFLKTVRDGQSSRILIFRYQIKLP